MSSDLELTSAQDGNPLTNEDPHRIAQYQENLNPQQPWMTVHALPNPEQPEPGRLVMYAGNVCCHWLWTSQLFVL